MPPIAADRRHAKIPRMSKSKAASGLPPAGSNPPANMLRTRPAVHFIRVSKSILILQRFIHFSKPSKERSQPTANLLGQRSQAFGIAP